jgi:hypothetical protein
MVEKKIDHLLRKIKQYKNRIYQCESTQKYQEDKDNVLSRSASVLHTYYTAKDTPLL